MSFHRTGGAPAALLATAFCVAVHAANARGAEPPCEGAVPLEADCDRNGLADACETETDAGMRFSPPVSFPVGGFPHVLEAVDLDGDGDLDILSTDRSTDTVTVLRNEGRAVFRPEQVLATGDEPRGIDSGDVDGDGDPDIVVGSGNEDSFGDLPTNTVFLNDGTGGLDTGRAYTALTEQAGALRSTHLTDLDGDGDLDILNGFSDDVDGGVITWLSNDGAGGFSEPRVVTGPGGTRAGLLVAKYVAPGRVDSDDLPDIVTYSGQVLLNLGRGSFSAPKTFAEVRDPVNLLLTDLDRDGDLDVALLEGTDTEGRVRIFLAEDGEFAEHAAIELSGQIQEGIAAPDLDGDGSRDLVVSFTESELGLLQGDGRGSFAPPDTFLPLGGGVPRWLVAADLNGDGRGDLAAPKMSNEVSLVFHLGAPDANRNGLPDECDTRFFRGDSDGDGALNLTDAIHLLRHLFLAGAAPPCAEAADADDSGSLAITDAVRILQLLFRGGEDLPPPGRPGSACPVAQGAEPFLGCEAYRPCGRNAGEEEKR